MEDGGQRQHTRHPLGQMTMQGQVLAVIPALEAGDPPQERHLRQKARTGQRWIGREPPEQRDQVRGSWVYPQAGVRSLQQGGTRQIEAGEGGAAGRVGDGWRWCLGAISTGMFSSTGGISETGKQASMHAGLPAVHAHVQVGAPVGVCCCESRHSYTHARTRARTHARAHTHTHAHTHARTHARAGGTGEGGTMLLSDSAGTVAGLRLQMWGCTEIEIARGGMERRQGSVGGETAQHLRIEARLSRGGESFFYLCTGTHAHITHTHVHTCVCAPVTKQHTFKEAYSS